MTIKAPRVSEATIAEINRALRELADASSAESKRVAGGEWVPLVVLAVEADAAFTFPTTKRLYSTPPAGALTTTNVRIFNTGQTIIRHALGRPPKGYVLKGQAQNGFVSRINLATLSGDYRDDTHVAFVASATGLYAIDVVG